MHAAIKIAIAGAIGGALHAIAKAYGFEGRADDIITAIVAAVAYALKSPRQE